MENFSYWNKTRHVYGEGDYTRVGELPRPQVKKCLLPHTAQLGEPVVKST